MIYLNTLGILFPQKYIVLQILIFFAMKLKIFENTLKISFKLPIFLTVEFDQFYLIKQNFVTHSIYDLHL